MNWTTLIFSQNPHSRLKRHILFWLCWFVFLVVSGSAAIGHDAKTLGIMISVDILVAIQQIVVELPICYLVLYFIIPKFFFKGRYLAGFLLVVTSVILSYWWAYVAMHLADPHIKSLLNITGPDQLTSEFIIIKDIVSSGGIFVCCSVMCSLKFLKFWYIKQQENILLGRENVVAELQLLKAQVHPHFLFNTLNNIYSFTITNSDLAASLMGKLNGILRYMMLDGQHAAVPLMKEIQLINDYISLEKVRYGERLKISLNITGNASNKMIAPLLMIPFVENSFKHGASKMLKEPIIELSITIEEDRLTFELINNKPADGAAENKINQKGGIGLKNAGRRLKLLYPEKHDISIESTDTMYSVRLIIKFQEINAPEATVKITRDFRENQVVYVEL